MSYTIAPNATEMSAARDILIRKSRFDMDLAREADERGDYATGHAYRQRAAQIDWAVDMLADCLAGIVPGV